MDRRLLTLDPSAICGFAHGDPFGDQKPPFSGTLVLPKKGSTSDKSVFLFDWLIDFMRGNRITELYVEKPFIQNTKSEDAIYSMLSLVIASGMAAKKTGAYCQLIGMQTWRSALGLPTIGPKNIMADPYYAQMFGARKGGGIKEAKRQYVKDRALEYARKLGSDPTDDNEGDAICIWYAVANQLKKKIVEPQLGLLDNFDL